MKLIGYLVVFKTITNVNYEPNNR